MTLKIIQLAFTLMPVIVACTSYDRLAVRSGTTGDPITIMVFGQSNGVSPANGFPPLYSETGHVIVNDYYCDGKNPTTNPPSCYVGMDMVKPTKDRPIRSNQTWLILGDLLYRSTGKDSVIYNTAIGGRSTRQLIAQAFPKFLATLRAHPQIDVVLWNQGESESHIPPDESYANLKLMIEESRVIISALSWIVGLNSGGRPAQTRIIAEGLAFPGPDIDAARASQHALLGDRSLEFEGPGHLFHADVWHDALMRWKPWESRTRR